MAARSTLLYSAAAVRRLLQLSDSTPVQLQEFFRVIWVWVKGERPTFISKQTFKEHFVAHRRAEAAHLIVEAGEGQAPMTFTVTNPAHQSRHEVRGWRDRIECDCDDYYWQQQTFGRGCCKHGYAVLAYLGYGSLKAYRQAHLQLSPEVARVA